MVFAEFLDEEAKDKVETKSSVKSDVADSTKKAKAKPLNLNIGVPKDEPMLLLTPKISVIGVGGAGGNAVNTMISSGLKGARFLVANTDAQALAMSYADCRIQLGLETTRGLGSGMNPAVGKAAAEEAIEKVVEEIKDANMLFIAVGMGGGTGTGAAPVIAKAAKELGILTVGVVTKPFNFEGKRRMEIALKGIEELSKHVDTIIVIPNQNLFRIATEKTSFSDAFKMADNVLYSGVRNITDLIMVPGLINLDFADVSTVIQEMGRAMMGSGEAEGENRAILAAEAAITNQLLDDNSMKGAKGILINITGAMDLTLVEVDAAAERIKSEVDPDANIIIGACLDPSLEGKMRVSVVATGISGAKKSADALAETGADIFGTKLSGFGSNSKVSSFASQILAKDTSSGTETVGNFAHRPFKPAKSSLAGLFTDNTDGLVKTTEEEALSMDAFTGSVAKAENEPAEEEQAPTLVIDELGGDNEMPVVTSTDDNFSVGAEPVMTIYDDEQNAPSPAVSHNLAAAENLEEPKKSYSSLFTKVTKFTLGRKKKDEADTSLGSAINPEDSEAGFPGTAASAKMKLGSAFDNSDEGPEDLEIPAFLRRR